MVEVTFTATAHRDGQWWVVQCDQHPGALSQVARLDQAAEHQREAIAFVADVDESEVEVEVHAILDGDLDAELEEASRLVEQAKQAEVEAGVKRRHIAQRLAEEGLTVRDIGMVMQVSYQRAHQLVKS